MDFRQMFSNLGNLAWRFKVDNQAGAAARAGWPKESRLARQGGFSSNVQQRAICKIRLSGASIW